MEETHTHTHTHYIIEAEDQNSDGRTAFFEIEPFSS